MQLYVTDSGMKTSATVIRKMTAKTDLRLYLIQVRTTFNPKSKTNKQTAKPSDCRC